MHFRGLYQGEPGTLARLGPGPMLKKGFVMLFSWRKDDSPVRTRVRHYALRATDDRCTTLFHSMMALVEGRTRNTWRHDPRAPDLVVVGATAGGTAGDAGALGGGAPCERPMAAFTGGRGPDCGALRLSAMVKVLDAVDDELAASTAPSVHQRSPGAVQLARWPRAEVLAADPLHPRLATLLLARPLTVPQLARLAGVPEDTCSAFLAQLSPAEWRPAEPAEEVPQGPGSSDPAPRGLLALIRSRLGLREVFS